MGIASNFFEHSRITDFVNGRNFMSRNVITILYGLLVPSVVLCIIDAGNLWVGWMLEQVDEL